MKQTVISTLDKALKMEKNNQTQISGNEIKDNSAGRDFNKHKFQ